MESAPTAGITNPYPTLGSAPQEPQTFNVFDAIYGQETERYANNDVNPSLRELANQTDDRLVQRRKHYLDELIAKRAQESREATGTGSAELDSLISEWEQSPERKTQKAQDIFDRILAKDPTITFDEWKVYDDHVGELRREYGGEMSLLNFLVGAKNVLGKAFEDGAQGLAEVHKDGEYWKIIPSIIEGGARDTRELFGSVWHAQNKDSLSYAVKQFLTGADTPEERYANFKATQEFHRDTDRFLNGEEGLVFDSRWTNKNLVALGEIIGDPSFVLGFFSGGSTAIAGIAAKSAKLTGAARAFHIAARAATATSRAVDYVTGLPLKAAGYPLWLAGAGAVKATGATVDGLAKVASSLTGGKLDGIRTAIRAAGITGAGLGLDPFSRKFAAFYGLGLVSEGIGGAAVGMGRAVQRQGILSVAERVAADSTLPNLTRKLATGLSKIDNVIPIPSIAADAVKGGMIGMSFNALLGAYADGTEGAYHSAMAGLGGGAFGGIAGSVASRVTDPSGSRFIRAEFDYQMDKLKNDDPTHYSNVMRFVGMHDAAGIETRHYILGVANRLAGTHKMVFMDGKTYASNVPAGVTSSAYEGVDANGARIIAINVDNKAMTQALQARAADPSAFEKGPFKRFRGGETTPVHEMFHGIMWNYGYKAGMINRLTHHLLGTQINGQTIIKSPISPQVLDDFFSVYARKIGLPDFYQKYQSDIKEYKDTGVINDNLRTAVEEFGAYFFEQWVKGKPLDYLFRGGDLGFTRNAFEGIKGLVGEAVRYGKRSMGIDLRENGYRFNEVRRRLEAGLTVHTAEGFYDASGDRVRDPVMDRVMEDMVKQTWNPPENTTIDTLSGESLRAWAVSNGQERRIFQDKKGVWRFKDPKVFEKEEGERGVSFFQTLEELRAQGIDIGAEIVKTEKGLEINGNLSIQALSELTKRNIINGNEARYLAAINDAIVRGLDTTRTTGRKTKLGPNGLRFRYHGLTQEEVGPDGQVRRKVRPWQDVDVTDRHVFMYRTEILLTTKDKDGKTIPPTFTIVHTGIDKDALERRTINALSQKVRMRNGKIVSGSELLGGYVGAIGKVRDYLRNLSKPNARPSELEFGGGPKGAAIRDLLHSIVGAVPTSGMDYINRPNPSLPANTRGPDHVFTSFRLDLMSMLEETKSQLTFNEELAYRRTQQNYQAEETLTWTKDDRPVFKDKKTKKEVYRGKNKVLVNKRETIDSVNKTYIFHTNDGIRVRSNLLLEDAVFKPNNVLDPNTGFEMTNEDGSKVKTNPVAEATKLAELLLDLGKAISVPIKGKVDIVPFNDKFVIVGKERGKNFLAVPEAFNDFAHAQRVAETVVSTERLVAQIRKADTPVVVERKTAVEQEGSAKKKLISEDIPWTNEHKEEYIRALRRVSVYNAKYPDAMPVTIQTSDGNPYIIERVDENGDIELDAPTVKQGYKLLEGLGLGSGRKKVPRGSERYNAGVKVAARRLVDDFKEGIRDPKVKNAITWYKANRQKIVAIYGPNANLFFDLLAACSPREGPQRNWEYAVEVMETYLSGKWDAEFQKAQEYRDAVFVSVENGTFRRGIQQQRAVELAQKNLKALNQEITGDAVLLKAQSYMQTYDNLKMKAAMIWLSQNPNISAETRTEVLEAIANDRFDIHDDYEVILNSVLTEAGIAEIVPSRLQLVKEAHKELMLPVNQLSKILLRPSTNKAKLDKKTGLPPMVRFGNHNVNIVEALLGQFERLNAGPKIRNYGLNLRGGGEQATIDLWAARTLRRIIYEGNGHKKYRLLPAAEQPVSSGGKAVINRTNFDNPNAVDPVTGKPVHMMTSIKDDEGDFFIGQDIFGEASKNIQDMIADGALFTEKEIKGLKDAYGEDGYNSIVGSLSQLEPHELQAILWFREKILWAKNGWTDGIGGELSSYEKGVEMMTGEVAPAVDADNKQFSRIQRYTIHASMQVPTQTAYVGLGRVGDLTHLKASKAIEARIRKTFGKDVVSYVFAPTQGAYLADQVREDMPDVTETNIYPEASLGIDVTTKGNPDLEWLEMLRIGRQLGLEGQQESVIVSESVTARHPNARDIFTVKFGTPLEYNSKTIEQVKARLATFARVGGFTLEPSLNRVGNKTMVEGISFLHVPELEAVYGVRDMKITLETEQQVAERRRQFKEDMDEALKAIGWFKTPETNEDGTSNYVRGDKKRAPEEFTPATPTESGKQMLKVGPEQFKADSLNLSNLITHIEHGFRNSVVMWHSEYASADPVYLGRRGLTVSQNVQRVLNRNEQAKQNEQRVSNEGLYRPEGTQVQPSDVASSELSDGSRQEGPVGRGQDSDVRTTEGKADGSLSDPSKAREYIDNAIKRRTDDRLGTIIEVGPNADFIVTRAKGRQGYEEGFRVVHKNDKFAVKFKTEKQALAYVHDRLTGKAKPPQNKDSRYDYYVAGVGIVSGVRRPAITEEGSVKDVRAAVKAGGLPSTHALYGYNIPETDVEAVNDPARGLFAGRALVDPVGEEARQMYQAAETMSPEDLDNMYFKAIADKDFKAAQKMVYAVARKNGYFGEYYHGSSSSDVREFESRPDAGIAVYVTPLKSMADRFSYDYYSGGHMTGKTFKLAVQGQSSGLIANEVYNKDFFDPRNTKHIKRLRDELEKLTGPNGEGVAKEWIDRKLKALKETLFFGEYETSYRDPIKNVVIPNFTPVQEALHKAGFLGYIEREDSDVNLPRSKNPDNIAIFRPEMVKSLDAVTRDDNGNIIPLSQRFNPKSKDINYQADEQIAALDRIYQTYAKKVLDGTATPAEKATVDRLLERQAKDKGYNFRRKWYHGTPKKERFNVYDLGEKPINTDTVIGHPRGQWVGTSAEFVKPYAREGGIFGSGPSDGSIFEYVKRNNDDKAFELGEFYTVINYLRLPEGHPDRNWEAKKYSELPEAKRNMYAELISNLKQYSRQVGDKIKSRNIREDLDAGEFPSINSLQVNKLMTEVGFTQYTIANGSGTAWNEVWVDLTGTQLKRPEITVDDSGNIIPLSKRFDEESTDTRYQAEETITAPTKPYSVSETNFKGYIAEEMADKLKGLRLVETERAGVKRLSILVDDPKLAVDAGLWYANGMKQNDVVGEILWTEDRIENPKVAHVEESRVTQDARRFGYGNVLYSELATRLSEKGVKKLTGSIVDPDLRPLKIRDYVFGVTPDRKAILGGATERTNRDRYYDGFDRYLSVSNDIEPNRRYQATEQLSAMGFQGLVAEKMRESGKLTDDFKFRVKSSGLGSRSRLYDFFILKNNDRMGWARVDVNYKSNGDVDYAHMIESDIDPTIRGQGFGNLLYSEVGTRLSQMGVTKFTGLVVDKLERPLKIREKVYGNTVAMRGEGSQHWAGIDADPELSVISRLEPNRRYQAEEVVNVVRLSGKMKTIPVDADGRVIDVKSSAFKTDFIGVVANDEMPQVKDQYQLYFGKATGPRFNYLSRNGRSKITKDTYALELMSGTNKVGFIRFDIVPDRAKKVGKVMNNIVVDIDADYRGNKLQHVFYSEAIERAKLLGARAFMQEIENDLGLPYRSQTKVLGKENSFLIDLYTGQTYTADEAGWREAKYPEYKIVKRTPDGTEVIETGRGENKYVHGYGNILENRRYQAEESPFDRYL